MIRSKLEINSFFIGPKLPFKLHGSTMVTSPTEKGVILIGGKDSKKYSDSNKLIELSGDTKESLKWTILEQKLKYPCVYHVSFLISNQILRNLMPI